MALNAPACSPPCEQRLAGAWRAVHEDTLWRVNAQGNKLLWVQHGQLDHLSHLLDLVLGPANVGVGDVRLLLDLHAGGRSKWTCMMWLGLNHGSRTDLFMRMAPMARTVIMVTEGSILGGKGI